MDGIELRPATTDDVEPIAALIRRAEVHDGIPRVLATEELAEDLGAGHVQLAADTRVAVRGGELAGWACVWNPPPEHRLDRLDRAELIGEVAPEHRGRGVGRALLDWSLARGRERLCGRSHTLPRFVRVNAFDWLDDRGRIYQRCGFQAVRWHDELIRPLDDLPPLSVPPGVTLLPWPNDRDEEVRAVRNAAFGDHWGSTVIGPDQWQSFAYGHGARPDLSVVAVDDDTGALIGMCANQAYPEDQAVTGRRDAWIANVGTLRAARGRGVASAMLVWSLAAFAEAGFSHAMLGVDAENPTGAARLYRNLGFEPLHRSITYEIEVTCAERGPTATA